MDFRTREQQAAFERCVGFLAEIIEKYSHVLDFPSSCETNRQSWDRNTHQEAHKDEKYSLTGQSAA